MSKSRGNAIAIGATADETARLIAGARTDAGRDITYDPSQRPEVSNLVLLAALCLERAPEDVAAEIGGRGSQALKRLVTDAVNERFRDIRARRAELIADRGHLRRVLARRDGAGAGHRRRHAAGGPRADAHGLPRDRVYAACAASASSRCSRRQDSVIATVRQSAMTASDITVGTCQMSVMSIFTPTQTRIAASP